MMERMIEMVGIFKRPICWVKGHIEYKLYSKYRRLEELAMVCPRCYKILAMESEYMDEDSKWNDEE